MTETAYHKPALLEEAITGLQLKPDGIYVDATFGGGGHSKVILEHIKEGKLYAFDHDKDALSQKIDHERFEFIRHNFKYMKRFLRYYEAIPVDGILADLGISSHQIDVPERGFSTRFDHKLDMRMDQDQAFSAIDVLNNYPEKDLQNMFSTYGEVTNAKTIARVIVKSRLKQPIKTIQQLIDITTPFIPKGKDQKYLAKLFQAIRIEVNDEVGALKLFLQQCGEVIRSGGRLVVISYHSIEDRLVKQMIRNGHFEEGVISPNPELLQLDKPKQKPFKIITKKPITPSEEEIQSNRRARSAKLRIAEKT